MRRILFDVRPSFQVLAVTATGILILLFAFAHEEWTHYREELAQSERNVRSAAVLLAEHTAQSFEAAEETLRVVAGLRLDAIEGGYDAAKVHELLKAIHGGSSLFRAIGWTNADGDLTATSQTADPVPLMLADSESFRFWHEHGSREHGAAHVATPRPSQALAAWIALVSVRAEDPDGRFDGIVIGAVDPDYFARVYSRVELGPGSVVTMFRKDGTILAREPVDHGLLGTSLAGRRFMTDIVASAPVGTFDASGLSDRVDRLVGYAISPENGFIITVATPRNVALAAFWRGLTVSGARVGLTILAVMIGTAYLVWQMRRREQLEADIKTSEARFRDLASLSGDWFWETDDQHRFVWRSGAVDGTDESPPPWCHEQSDMSSNGVPDEAWQSQLTALQERRPFRELEYRRRDPAGDRWLRASGVPIFGSDGQFRGYRGAVQDVTALRHAEQALRDAVEAIPGGVLLFDAADRLAYVNANSTALLPGMAAFDRIGETFETILRRTVAAGLVRDAEADPEAWIAWRLQHHGADAESILIRHADRVIEVIERRTVGGGTMVIRFDVTQRERARTAESMAREAADAANRAKSDFLSRMSHELRSPLNAVIGFGELLQTGGTAKPVEAQNEYAGYIVQAGRHLLDLVKEVLDITGIEAGRLQLSPRPVALGDVLAQAVRTMQPAAESARIRLDIQLTQALPAVKADPQRLRQVLLNLLSNAIKYNRPGGTVTVRVDATKRQHVQIAIIDTGLGIPLERQGQVFEPFQRLGAEFTEIEGTGIGLALSKRLVEAMNGRIAFESEPGKGTTFWVELPIATGAPAAVDHGSGPGAAPTSSAGGYSLLYIEDSQVNLNLVQYMMETLPDVTMSAARSGREGIELGRAERPDVILLDIQLPDMDGYEVLRHLQTDPATRNIPVIALTASAMPRDVNRGLAAGFFRYLTKPLDFGQLSSALDAATRGRRITRHDQAELRAEPRRSAVQD